jgi:hypothetical protein
MGMVCAGCELLNIFGLLSAHIQVSPLLSDDSLNGIKSRRDGRSAAFYLGVVDMGYGKDLFKGSYESGLSIPWSMLVVII